MIACDKCEDWFHCDCINLDPDYMDLCVKYYCKSCEKKYNIKSVWTIKCMLPDCFNPAEEEFYGKYCCFEHCIDYLTLVSENVLGVSKEKIASTLTSFNDVSELKQLLENSEVPPHFEADEQLKIAVNNALILIEKRKNYLKLAVNRRSLFYTTYNKPICGYDERLHTDDDWVVQHCKDSELEVDNFVCSVRIDECYRHMRWDQIYTDIQEFKRTLLTQALDYSKEQKQGDVMRKRAYVANNIFPLLPAEP